MSISKLLTKHLDALATICYASHIATSFQRTLELCDMTKRLQAVSRNVALDALPQKCKCHKQHKSTNFWRGHLCPLCAFVARRTPGEQLQARERAVMKSQLNSRRELPYVR